MNKGDILIVNLEAGLGHEQHGERPAILISDTKTNILIVVPLTAKLEALCFPHTLTISPEKGNGLNQDSVALLFHLKAIDKFRVNKVIGKLSKNIESKIDKILKGMLKLQ